MCVCVSHVFLACPGVKGTCWMLWGLGQLFHLQRCRHHDEFHFWTAMPQWPREHLHDYSGQPRNSLETEVGQRKLRLRALAAWSPWKGGQHLLHVRAPGQGKKARVLGAEFPRVKSPQIQAPTAPTGPWALIRPKWQLSGMPHPAPHVCSGEILAVRLKILKSLRWDNSDTALFRKLDIFHTTLEWKIWKIWLRVKQHISNFKHFQAQSEPQGCWPDVAASSQQLQSRASRQWCHHWASCG